MPVQEGVRKMPEAGVARGGEAVVTLTERAIEKVKERLARHEDAELALRVYVKGGGCSGLSYGMALDHPRANDHVIDAGGIKVVIDPASAVYLKGSQIDYKEALMGGGFAIHNPNAIRTCGCGQSFRTADDAGKPGEPCC